MKTFKITVFLLAFSLATAPYFAFIGHAAIHLVTSDHEHVDEQTAEPHHHDHHGEHHILVLTPLSLAVVVSNFKIQPVIKIISELTAIFQSIEKVSLEGYDSFMDESPPPRIEPFISLLLHPATAPPAF